jgi:hypothetical protein
MIIDGMNVLKKWKELFYVIMFGDDFWDHDIIDFWHTECFTYKYY